MQVTNESIVYLDMAPTSKEDQKGDIDVTTMARRSLYI
jgi:hypothetical protein